MSENTAKTVEIVVAGTIENDDYDVVVIADDGTRRI